VALKHWFHRLISGQNGYFMAETLHPKRGKNNRLGLKYLAMQRRKSNRPGGINSAASRASLLSSDESGRFDELVGDLVTAFVRVSLPEIDEEINRSLKRIAIMLHLDRSTIAEFKANGFAFFSHGWVRDEDYRVIGKSLDANALLPWTKAKMLAGETVVMLSVDELPEEAAIDRESLRAKVQRNDTDKD
jgi:hypothetical protein